MERVQLFKEYNSVSTRLQLWEEIEDNAGRFKAYFNQDAPRDDRLIAVPCQLHCAPVNQLNEDRGT